MRMFDRWNRSGVASVEPHVTSTDIPLAIELLDGADPTLYGNLLRDARAAKRSPVWLLGSGDNRLGLAPIPDDPTGAIDALDPQSVLAGWWPGPCPDGCACLEPFTGQLPELARSASEDRSRLTSTIGEAEAFAHDHASFATLAVVDTARPADIPAVMGWGGTINYRHQDLVGVSAVLRSWEERFGAVLTVMADAVLLLSVADPPTSRDEAERVATEHFSFCPDQHDPQNGTLYTPRTYAKTIQGKRWWRFWWD